MSVLLIFLTFIAARPFPLGGFSQPPSQTLSSERSDLTGVYRIDLAASDKLYSVVAGASSNVPFQEQQRFFIDLAVRFTPPDLLAIEQNGNRISLGSSRASRMTFVADGVPHSTRGAEGQPVRVRFAINSDRLSFRSDGRGEDNFSVVFQLIDGGKRLQVVRTITAEGLAQPLTIRSIYNKISDSARWELYGEQLASSSPPATRSANPGHTENSAANLLRQALREWIDATNSRDIEKQMLFYVPRLAAFYLSRNTPQDFVRDEKARVFATAKLIDIHAEDPEIIFQDGGRIAIMRYRKKYRVVNGRQSRQGEVIQELRWQRDGQEWHIYSERDIRVLQQTIAGRTR